MSVSDSSVRSLKLSALVFSLVLTRASALGAQTPRSCQHTLDDANAANASVLCVMLYVSDGRLKPRGPHESRLYPSNVMDSGKPLDQKTRERIEASLIDDLTSALAGAPRISYFGLTDDERGVVRSGGALQPVDALSADNWDEAYVTAFQKWADSVPGRRGLGDSVAELISSLKLEDVTGLAQMANGLDAEEGFLMLAAADLTPSLGAGQTVCFETASDICRGSGVVADRARVAQVLSKFEGLPWHKLAMKTRLDTYYGNRGLTASVEISSSDLPTFIKITESDIVTRILWSRSLDTTPVLVDEFLSVLLNRRDFGDYVANPKLVTDFNIAGQPAARQLRFSFNPAPAEEGANTSTLKSPAPLFNTFSLAPQQAALDGLGLILTVQQGTGINTLDMLVQPKSPSGSATPPDSAPAAAPSLPTVQGTAQPTGTERNPLSPITPPKPATAQLQPQAPREQSRFIGGGAFYRPEQSVKPFVQFQQSHLNLGSAVATLSGQFGGNGSAFGSGTGRVDYLWFKELHHRLSAELSGGTDFTQQRLIAGAPVDERRTGAFARLEYEALGGNNDSHMTIGVEARRTTVGLSGDTPTAPDLTIVGAVINVVYTQQNLVSAHPFHLSVEPSIQLGRAISGNDANYAVGAVRANLNQHLLETVLTTVDVSAGVQSATASTPLVEQPSLGASNTLRGFRADDVIGTSLWFLQPELWFDVSGVFGRTRVADFAAKNLRLAGFVDVGGASGVVAPAAGGVRWGPGLGLRFFQGPIALKLDWARGIGDGASGRGRGRFFLGVSTARTF